MTGQNASTHWRATGPYTPNNASKAGLLEEIRLFFLTYDEQRDLGRTRQLLLHEKLPQRSRATRITILRFIQERLTRWNPPSWVLDDLVYFTQDRSQPSLEGALLLHAVRQDRLLYDFVQLELVPRWYRGEHTLVRADVQHFLDKALPEHPEIEGWNHSTREKLAGNVLSILRDYRLLQGRERKVMVEPNIPLRVAMHLVRLLQEEGVEHDAIATHPDWNIWLWEPQRVSDMLFKVAAQEREA